MTTKKKIWFIFGLIVFLTIGLFLLLYTKHPKIEETADIYKEVVILDQIENLRLYNPKTNGISYLECSANKSRIIEKWNSDILTVYFMYLGKTMQGKDNEVIREIIYGLKDTSKYSKERVVKDALNFLNQENLEELDFFNGININETLEKIKNSKKENYYKNILKFSNAKNIEGCQEIIIDESDPEDKSILLKNACILAFTHDFGPYCKKLAIDEIKSINGLEQIENLKLYDLPINGFSYFECSENKSKMMDICKKNRSEKICAGSLATTYIMYLYKTGQKDFEFLDKVVLEGVESNDVQFSVEEIVDDVHNFLNKKDAKSKYLDELNLLKGIDVDETLKKSENDKKRQNYFENILRFASAGKIEDCDEIIIEEIDPTIQNGLLKDACELAFTQNRYRYCRKLIIHEVLHRE
ncbi:MAG: hypothetical protein KAU20_04120 [Nanoarchaeota archaeon]|nr:hypothetical protein [Nanoarchaeota archaeon]